MSQIADSAVVLSNDDIADGAELLMHNCEDCACAVSGQPAAATVPGVTVAEALADDRAWASGPEVLEIRLDSEHTLLFNPVGDGSPAVLNQAAYDIFSRFKAPASLRDIVAAHEDEDAGASDVRPTFARLRQLSLISPDGLPAAPAFADSSVLTAWLHVTNACNLRCPYCYVHKSPEGMDEATGTAAVEAIVASAVRHGLTGVKLT